MSMPKLVVVNRSGEESTVEAAAGLSVMEAIRDNGFDELLALCRQRVDRPISGLIKTYCSPAPGAAAIAAGIMKPSGPWRWTRSCPGTRTAQTSSATYKPSASAAMPETGTSTTPTSAVAG
jgi:hypothetical protein